ncbi:MAG: hypothetical protein WCX65_13215 [bacterium]
MDKCVVCGSECEFKSNPATDIFEFNCGNCGGKFKIFDRAADRIKDVFGEDRYKISSFINEMILRNDINPLIFEDKSNIDKALKDITYDFSDIKDNFPKTVTDILDRILLNIYKKTPVPGDNVKIPYDRSNDSKPYPFFYSKYTREAFFI